MPAASNRRKAIISLRQPLLVQLPPLLPLHYLAKYPTQILLSHLQYTSRPPHTPRRFPDLALAPSTPTSPYTPHHATLLGCPEAINRPVRGVYPGERLWSCKGIYLFLLTGGCGCFGVTLEVGHVRLADGFGYSFLKRRGGMFRRLLMRECPVY